MTMGDRVAVLRAGTLEQYGSPRELYDRPASLFVASFIGSPSMNLYEAGLESDAVVGGSQRIALPRVAGLAERDGLGAYRGRKVIVGIRPEHLVLEGSEGAGPAGLAVEVRLVEALGSEQLVHFRVDAAQVRGDEAGAEGGSGSGFGS